MKTPIYKTHKFHKQYLKISGFLVALFGPICFLGTIPELAEPARLTLDLLSWPIDGRESLDDSTVKLVSALLGGFLLGYGVTIWSLSSLVYDKAPEMVRRAVLIGLCSWFVLDSSGSIAGGHASNALWNILVLILFVGPLWLPAKGQIKTT
ncbi:hypothetical protein ACOKFD_09925 [Flagellimonas sp. S174]|uniref:hypothetical protein n=1 Tax=Flagellimonas sp. S174 TaxID=3410790 RepID=UPI003BF49632